MPARTSCPASATHEAEQCGDQVGSAKMRGPGRNTSRQREREDVQLRVAEEEIAERDHHFTAMMPQKLYHLKNTST